MDEAIQTVREALGRHREATLMAIDAASEIAGSQWPGLAKSQALVDRTDAALTALTTLEQAVATLRAENERLRHDLDAYHAENQTLKSEAEERSNAIDTYIRVHEKQKLRISILRAGLGEAIRWLPYHEASALRALLEEP